MDIQQNKIGIIKNNKAFNICQLIIGIVIIQSCSTYKNTTNSKSILAFECESVTIRDLLLEGDTYPAIARENQVEAIIKYKIMLEGNIIDISIIDANYITISSNKIEDKRIILNEIFTKMLNRILSFNCSNELTDGIYKIVIAYKLNETNFSPNPKEYDILIQRKKVELIEFNSHK